MEKLMTSKSKAQNVLMGFLQDGTLVEENDLISLPENTKRAASPPSSPEIAAPPSKKKKKSKKSVQAPAAVQAPSALPDIRYILAPMVGASELPFRLLCRKYGASIAYTPMISSARFCLPAEEAYREEQFQTNGADRPLVAHFSANNPDEMASAAKLVESR